MKYIYVIRSFDARNMKLIEYVVAFETEKEAQLYCKWNASKTLFHEYKKVSISWTAAPEE